jgi:ribose transport system permease protein
VNLSKDGLSSGRATAHRVGSAARTRLDPFAAVPVAILISLVVTTLALSPGLARYSTVETKSNAALTLVLAASGQTFPILTGGIDLSIGSIISLSNSLIATRMTDDLGSVIFWTLAIALLGLTTGAINGFVVAVMRVTPFIATLATWSVWSGVALLVLDSDGGTVSPTLKQIAHGHVLSLPVSLVILLVVLGAWRWFQHTRSGLRLYAVGTSERGAALGGANVVRVKVMAYALSGLFAAMAGLYRTVQVGSGSPVAGNGFILPSVAAVVLGGTSLAGGRGGVGMSVIGALIMLFINDLIFFAGVRTFYTPMVQGILVVITVAISAYGYNRSLQRAQA